MALRLFPQVLAARGGGSKSIGSSSGIAFLLKDAWIASWLRLACSTAG